MWHSFIMQLGKCSLMPLLIRMFSKYFKMAGFGWDSIKKNAWMPTDWQWWRVSFSWVSTLLWSMWDQEGTHVSLYTIALLLYSADTSSYALGELNRNCNVPWLCFTDSWWWWGSVQVIWAFLSLMYKYVGISMHKKVVPDEIKGRLIHHGFPVTIFVVLIALSPLSALICVSVWAHFVLLYFTC